MKISMDSGARKLTTSEDEVKRDWLSLLASVKDDIVIAAPFDHMPSGKLTPREREVLRLVALGLNNTEIGQRLFRPSV